MPDLGRFRVGEWEVNQAENALCSEGRAVRLEPRVMDVLVYLAAEAGRVVSKEELLAAVWGGVFVEEGALTQAIHSLRKALGDDARQPRYVKTISRRGYLLVAIFEPGETLPERSTVTYLPVSLPESVAQPIEKPTGKRWLLFVFAVAIGLAAILLARVWDLREPPSSEGKPRIVVLPFRNFGETQDGYFTEGLSEEITRDLASLASLHVISQTSAVRYVRDRKPLSQIARELEVDYVLDGTVAWGRGVGDEPRVRIAPRLFRVVTDAHIRADPYERGVKDIFEVKAEISRWVLGQLDVPVALKQGQRLRTAPTEHLEAYQAYRRGLEIRNQPYYSEEHIRRAVPMFQRAVELDPQFAAAWAELSQSQSYLAFNADPSPAQLERALQPLKRALEIDRHHPDVRLAEAYFSYRCLGEYETAEKQLLEAARLYPNDPRFLEPLAYVLRRRGRLKDAIEKLERASSLDPLAAGLVLAIGETYRAMREYGQADLYFDRATSMAPDQVPYWVERALNQLAWTGDVDKAREILEKSPVRGHPRLMAVQFLLDFYEREYERALGRITPESLKTLDPLAESRILTLTVISRERLGDTRGARAAAEANHAILAARVARFPIDPFHRGYLAVTLAQLGRKDEAVAHMEKALQVFPDDLYSGPRTVEIQVMMETVLGNRRKAIDRLSWLLATPYQSSISATDLRLNPVWDPLHEDSDFKKLLWKL
ncbi:MAG TPA: winged helix-turn-helix domain-containing protein [Thermoanaerobaculia bacterium]|nr:winged helix-turn-helix domain-containing protein [Thermoanaerobaculia bacterium]